MKQTNRNDWLRYEEEKRRAWDESKTTAEYEDRLRELLKEMGM